MVDYGNGIKIILSIPFLLMSLIFIFYINEVMPLKEFLIITLILIFGESIMLYLYHEFKKEYIYDR